MTTSAFRRDVHVQSGAVADCGAGVIAKKNEIERNKTEQDKNKTRQNKTKQNKLWSGKGKTSALIHFFLFNK
jgi:hypothetical protein